MRDLWKKRFDAKEFSDTAQSIIQEQCDYLNKNTNGMIIAKIVAYDGPTQSYIAKPALANMSEVLGAFQKERTVNIQEDLGEIGEGSFTFEFFITSVATPNYKYRVMFVEYGIAFFPVYLTLDESIALELGVEESMECVNQEEFEKILEKILNSEKIEKVINNLLTIGKTAGKGKSR